MILYSKIRWWVFGGFVALMTLAIILDVTGRNATIPAIGLLVYILIWLIIDKWSGWIKHDMPI